jgi:transcriptional regulator with XRE-family HTH domain
MAPRKKKRKPPSPEALILLYLRSRRGWTQKELGDRLGLGDHARISRFERGEKPLHREKLIEFAAALGYPPEAVDLLLEVHQWLEALRNPVEPSSPADLTVEEQRAVHRTVLAATGAFMAEVRREMIRKKRERKADLARRKARELWLRLKEAPRQDQRDLVAVMPAFQDWALAVHVCEASVRAAAHRPEDALHLADLAVLIASRSPGDEGWRSRLEGFCWAHLANARRVANDFPGADKAFAKAWELWAAGTVSAPDLLPEWLLYAMEASLRREQHKFPAALELLERARDSRGSDSGLILLQREHIYEQMGDIRKALEALEEAAPLVKVSGDIRLLFALRFKTVNHLCQLGQFREASERVPQLRELAIQQGNELDLLRVIWLEARVAAGQGELERAVEGLEQVRRDFTTRGLPYDAARASLELAVLYLENGRSAEVRALASTMAWIFNAQGVTREALAVLTLFCDTAKRETATAELARQVIADLERIKPSASLAIYKQRGRG